VRGALDLIACRYPAFVFGGAVGRLLPVFHFHEATQDALEPAFRYLAENRYSTIVSDDAAAFARDGRGLPDRAVMLAFDDAWASLWLVVGPLLRKYGLRAVTYAIPGRLQDGGELRPTIDAGHVDAAAADRAEYPFVTWQELRALSTEGLVDVQSHTWSHSQVCVDPIVRGELTADTTWASPLDVPRLNTGTPPRFLPTTALGAPLLATRSRMSDGKRFLVDDEARLLAPATVGSALPGRFERDDEQYAAIESELVQAREALQERLGTRVDHICLPWGVSGRVTRTALTRVGLSTAFANRWRGTFAVRPGDDPYALKRLNSRLLFALPGSGRRTLLPWSR
jgi:peptidoglycan/xylan/chitin deacetylase (PgdA/CDA1 family)